MFLTLFKTISSVLLIAVLVFVISHREIVLEQKTKFSPGSKKVVQVAQPLEQKSSSNEPVLQLQTSTTTETPQRLPPAVSDTPSPSISVPKQAPKIATAEVIPKNTEYIKMETGSSDTDESYRPQVSPCKVTMKYKIGRFDTNFGISQSKFIDEVNAASSLWGSELGKKLFTYDENGSLTINLIYDERQARTEDVNNLALEIQNSKDAANALKNLYEQEKAIYTGDGEQLTKDSDALMARYKIYADKVAMYNSNGGAPQAEYDIMTKELASLKATSKELESRRDALLIYMDKINAKVTHYNELVVYINGLIKQSNALGTKKFTEGRFNPNTNTIDIYQYNDLIKLRRVITHELGHVLGINHNKNAYSIMYDVNSATTTMLSDEDISDLMEVCPK